MKAKILKAFGLLVVGLLIGGASVFAEDVDLATGLSVTPAITVPILEPEGVKQLEILWDLTHGVYLLYEPSGYFSDLTAVLAGTGFGMNTTTLGVNNIDLTVYDVVVICVTSAWDSPYQAVEVTALANYVDQGGGLLIMGAGGGCPNGNINPVSQEFGTTCGGTTYEPDDLYFTDFIAHEIFDGISTLYFRATGVLTCTAPSVEAAWSPTYFDVLISLVDPSPRVVILGTCTGFSNAYFSNADNIDHSINVFTYLSGYPTVIELDTWGAIKAMHD